MNYHNIDLIIEVCSNQFKNYKDFISDVNQHISEDWIILNIEYEREPKFSTITSYTLGHVNLDKFNNAQTLNIPQHEIALHLASLYIQQHNDKYEVEQKFEFMCEDFCEKYSTAKYTIDKLNKNYVTNIK